MKKLRVKYHLIEEPLEKTEVWMAKESGALFLVHPLFLNTPDCLVMVAVVLDDDTSADLVPLKPSAYKWLKKTAVKIGYFYDDESEILSVESDEAGFA